MAKGKQISIGYDLSISAVPEPETYGMLLAGLGLIGVAARRRRSA
ncbi:MAG TPA: FxDxF family PEP-CTERM protein [Duganella sp.]|nr:FxDxF family PEP-CTERM protein [Duganella sp.]